MGRLEKQILFAALALVAVLLTFAILRGIDFKDPAEKLSQQPPSEWVDPVETPALVVPPKDEGTPASGLGDFDMPLVLPDQGASGNGLEAGREPAMEASPAPEPGPPGDPGLERGIKEDPRRDSGPRAYQVQPGDSLSVIAKRELGSIRYQLDIEALNPGVDENTVLQLGQTLLLPGGSQLGQKVDLEAAPVLAGPGEKLHKVRSGDSLWRIAERYYGSATQQNIQRIVAANPGLLAKGVNTVLKLGSTLRIPGASSQP